jgi:hypothetical protein
MKKLLIISFLALGITQAASVFIPKIKPKQELPEVILDGYRSRSYSTEVTSFCPRDLTNTVTQYPVDEDSVEIFKHCDRCRTGVYANHKGEEGRSCTYCGVKE